MIISVNSLINYHHINDLEDMCLLNNYREILAARDPKIHIKRNIPGERSKVRNRWRLGQSKELRTL